MQHLFGSRCGLSLLVRDKAHAVGPLPYVHEGNEADIVEDALGTDGRDYQRDAEEARVREGGSEVADSVLAADDAGHHSREDKEQKRDSRSFDERCRMLCRVLDEEGLDDDSRKGKIDQDVADDPVSLHRDLAGTEQRIADADQKKHHEHLESQHGRHVHGKASKSVLPSPEERHLQPLAMIGQKDCLPT